MTTEGRGLLAEINRLSALHTTPLLHEPCGTMHIPGPCPPELVRSWGDSLADGMDDTYLAHAIAHLEDEIANAEARISAHRRSLADLRREQDVRRRAVMAEAEGRVLTHPDEVRALDGTFVPHLDDEGCCACSCAGCSTDMLDCICPLCNAERCGLHARPGTSQGGTA